ncbi:penicillin acylase family protein [Achromobacter aloeverae]|uniref:Penicillin acylase family protein n=1 Tax=Achromobacter aloeverae TaxID=1750518 RepID=A0A4Q1HJU0_9BURK|nr:penicillin acylase family protein [Achromobacter aloeverae]RXN90376.1 penicillin acylase family protein [Achromobacter aloeverae]
MRPVEPRRGKWRRRGLGALATVVLVGATAALAAWGYLRASLPRLDGVVAAAGLASSARIERDAQGVTTVTAANRLDLAYATGYAHGQDRFFQMDLLRRVAAGEVSALVGADAVPLDRRNRLHRFRARAEAAYAALEAGQQTLLRRYADGVNAAMRATRARPFEYALLQAQPEPWRPEDTLLVVDAMYLDLQSGEIARVLGRGMLRDSLSPDMLAFLTPAATEIDAPLDQAPMTIPALTVPAERPDWLDGSVTTGRGAAPVSVAKEAASAIHGAVERRRADATASAPAPSVGGAGSLFGATVAQAMQAGLDNSASVGSNSFAVDGAHGAGGRAMVANDMHLGLGLPNIWYRLTLVLAGPDGQQARRLSGVSLPGAPLVVAGSNGDVAWGFTNSYGHYIDLVRVDRDPGDPRRYRGADGQWRQAEDHVETIAVRGGEPVRLDVHETPWGPLFRSGGASYAIRWVAYLPQAVDLGLMAMEQARDLTQALAVAQRAGVPAQNILVADRHGRIGWTLAGPLPASVLDPGGYPVPAAASGDPGRTSGQVADAAPKSGHMVDVANVAAPAGPAPPSAPALRRLAPADYPIVLDPPSGRLWTANSTQLGNAALQARIGDGGADIGTRSQQIRDDLLASPSSQEGDLLAIQLDDRASWLAPWRDLLLGTLDADATAGHPRRAEMARLVAGWNGRADADAVGYTLVRAFREALYQAWFGGLDARLAARTDADRQAGLPAWPLALGRASSRMEAVMRALARERAWVPRRYADNRAFMLAMADDVIAQADASGGLAQARWGDRNRLALAHPFARLLPPALRGWLAAPDTPMPGDQHLPRVQRPAFGASERFAVSPGQEALGILHMPGGASGHPLSPYFLAGNAAWVEGRATPFLPGKTRHRLDLKPMKQP